MLDWSVCPEKNPSVEEEIIDNEILVHHPDHQEVHNLNETAAFIWNVANGDYSLERIIDVLHEEADGHSREKIERDVEELIQELKEKDLLRSKNPLD